MTKLWQNNIEIDKEIEKFTVGNDYILDKTLLKYDIKASIAHAKMLAKIKILSEKEFISLKKELENILRLDESNKFKIQLEDEDCHTAIENHLTKKLGSLGKKSTHFVPRNDQVKTILHLYSKEKLKEIEELILKLETELKIFSKHDIAIPGYTHYQKAMPTSFKSWSEALIAGLEDDLKLLRTAIKIIDQNPLGSAAGFGVPYEIDRELVTKELNFAKTQEIGYVQNSRGKFESIILNVLTQIMLDLNKISTDIIMFNMSEFGFINLPDKFTTGSSIMPQKKNPDVLELIRGKYAIVLGYETQIKTLISNLISGYHRDFQLTKEPLIKSINITIDSLKIIAKVISGLEINKNNCKKAMTKELYATEEAYKLVKQGISFRDAYKKIKENLEK